MGRKQENRKTFLARVDADTPEKIQKIAESLGYTYGGKGSQGKLLDAIANEELILYKKVSTSP